MSEYTGGAGVEGYYEDPYVTLIHGDVLAALGSLEAGSVQCVVTSPPYWALRDYGTGTWEGGDPACEHQKTLQESIAKSKASSTIGGRGNTGHAYEGYGGVCGRCGAVRTDQQLGSEAVPDCLGWATGVRCGECYICHMVAVFDGVKRVLREDGCVFLNIGDSYAAGGRGGEPGDGSKQGTNAGSQLGPKKAPPGLKAKDLVLIPARLALALQASGWYVRSHIVWAKKAPMPESTTDRPSSAWESVWLLTKAAHYYYDAEAVRDKASQPLGKPLLTGQHKAVSGGYWANGPGATSTLGSNQGDAGRNQRNFWLLGPEPTPEAHFATFVSEIPRRAILAGTSERGCCPACGAPWVRVMEREFIEQSDYRVQGQHKKGGDKGMDASNGWGDMPRGNTIAHTLGWRQACACPPADAVPCVVMDPFVGSGTTVAVAKSLGRYSVGIDLSAAYLAIAIKRVQAVSLPFKFVWE